MATSTTASTATTTTASRLSPLQRAGLALLFAILAAVAVQSARLGASGLHAQLAHREMGHSGIAAAEPVIRESLGYFPSNPWALELMGTLELAKAHAAQAHRHYRQALQERPTSPVLWANLALARLNAGELDAEFSTALRHAATLGPWEPGVQVLIAEIGLREWDRLQESSRAIVRSSLARGLKRQDEKLFDVATAHGRLDVLCASPGVQRSRRALQCI